MDFRTRITLTRTGIPRRYWDREISVEFGVMEWYMSLQEVLFDQSSEVFGQGLVLCGRGASANAAWVAQHALSDNQDLPAPVVSMFVDWGELMDDLNDRAERSGIMADAKSPLLLVLDQVEMISRPEWATTVLTRIVKARYDEGKPTLITTSKSIDLAHSSLDNCLDFGPNIVRFVETLGEEG